VDGEGAAVRRGWSAEAGQLAALEPPPPEVDGAAGAGEEVEEDELSFDDDDDDDEAPPLAGALSLDDEVPSEDEALARLSVR
jgi:hypothetical protein